MPAANHPVRPFEWLTNFNSLSRLLSQPHLFPDDGADDAANDDRQQVPPHRRALHVGCGTSTLGESLVERLGYGLVVNVDRDGEALANMERRWNDRRGKGGGNVDDGVGEERMKSNHGAMKWLRMDFSAAPNRIGQNSSGLYSPGYFDLVVDKSTLDCALCSDDAAAGLLLASHSALRPDGGAYFVISFHHVDFILPLLRDCPGVDWYVEHHIVRREVDVPEQLADRYKARSAANEEPSEPGAPVGNEGEDVPESAWSSGSFIPTAEYGRTVNVFICRRRGKSSTFSSGLDFDKVKDHVHRTNDDWFKANNPLVTHTREVDLRRGFAKLLDLRRQENCGGASSAERLPLKDCYGALFTDAEREHLTYEFFLEDWDAFVDERRGADNEVPADGMSIDIALQFLKCMQ